MKMFIFDIDGTLLLTGGVGRLAFDQIFSERFGIQDAWGATIPDGKTDPVILQEIAERTLKRPLSGPEYADLREHYLAYFLTHIEDSPRFRLLPGVAELLHRLSETDGILMGIATGNFEKAAWAKLKKGGIDAYFRFGGFGSDSPDRLELTRMAIERGITQGGLRPSKQEVFVIGDTVHDIRAGKALGVKTVAVGTGRTSREELERQEPDCFFRDFSDTEAVIKAIFL